MSNKIIYKINPPISNVILKKDVMNDEELREYALQIIPRGSDSVEIWKEKITKDPIENVIDWFRSAGYIITVQ